MTTISLRGAGNTAMLKLIDFAKILVSHGFSMEDAQEICMACIDGAGVGEGKGDTRKLDACIRGISDRLSVVPRTDVARRELLKDVLLGTYFPDFERVG